MIFVRLFLVPIGITLSTFLFTDQIQNIRSGIIVFSISFFLNWIADKLIVDKLIRKKNDKP